MESHVDIENRWRQLDPIFIMGPQRSGTSIVALSLRGAGCIGFGEGHLWFELAEPLARFRDPNYRKDYRNDSYALGAGRNVVLERYVAVALDEFHRDHLPSHTIRWIDKSPGADAVKQAPLLAEIFPDSQFIFMFRNGISAVNSGITLWASNPDIFQVMCRVWAETMYTWRNVRGSLEGRYIEIAQEEMTGDPEGTAARLAAFLHIENHLDTIAELFRSQRTNTAFPDKPPGDYSYEISWSKRQKKYFIQMCGEEMRAWGYSIDFTEPIGRSPGGAKEPSDAMTWSDRWRKAWSILCSDGPLALLDWTRRFLYWRYIRPGISALKGRSS